ncbi:MAG: ribonuclease P protein component [Paracoccaceae bacterium]
MTEPARRRADLQGAAASAAPVLPCPKPVVLKKRADFLAAARARRQASRAFVLQARKRRANEASTPHDALRIGYTCSKKVGNAVARNRAKRRLRAAAHEVLAKHAKPGWDYVLIGRRDETAAIDFARLCDDLRITLAKIHAPRPQKPQSP